MILALLVACAPTPAPRPVISNHMDPVPTARESIAYWKDECVLLGGRPLCFVAWRTEHAGQIRCGCCPRRVTYETCRAWF